jgi:hypothetical protein
MFDNKRPVQSFLDQVSVLPWWLRLVYIHVIKWRFETYWDWSSLTRESCEWHLAIVQLPYPRQYFN